MDKSFDTWFARFMWGTDVVFLAASTPHIAAWYAHFDNPTDPISTAYAWAVGFGLAIAIDGVSLMLLFALTRMIRQGKKNTGTKIGILLFMGFIAGLSWLINWQYDMEFANNTFARADATTINVFVQRISIGSLNPIIGGAFSVLIMAYALIGKVVKEDDKPAMTDAEYEAEKLRIHRENDLKQLRNTNGQGLLARGREAVLGQGTDALTLLDKTLAYLRDADELRRPEHEQRAIQALSAYLKIKPKDVLPLLIQSRSIIAKEDQAALASSALLNNEQHTLPEMNAASGDDPAFMDGSPEGDEDLLDGLQGRDTVSLERAAEALNCQVKHVVTLRNQGKLKHGPKRDDRITVASLRAYLAARGRRGGAAEPQAASTSTEKLRIVPKSEQVQKDEEIVGMVLDALRDNPVITDEELAQILGKSKPAAARFWRLKAQEIQRQRDVVRA